MIGEFLKSTINIASFLIDTYKKHVRIKRKNKDFETMDSLENIIDDNTEDSKNSESISENKNLDLESDVKDMKEIFKNNKD